MEKDRRFQARKEINIPINFSKGCDDQYHQAVTRNVSVNGICFESTQIFSQGEWVFIKRNKPLPDFEPLQLYDVSAVQVKWCQRKDIDSTYGVGIKQVGKAKVIKKEDVNPSIHCCELCGALSTRGIIKTNEHLYLCLNCFTLISQLPGKTLKANLTRFMIGNVI